MCRKWRRACFFLENSLDEYVLFWNYTRKYKKPLLPSREEFRTVPFIFSSVVKGVHCVSHWALQCSVLYCALVQCSKVQFSAVHYRTVCRLKCIRAECIAVHCAGIHLQMHRTEKFLCLWQLTSIDYIPTKSSIIVTINNCFLSKKFVPKFIAKNILVQNYIAQFSSDFIGPSIIVNICVIYFVVYDLWSWFCVLFIGPSASASSRILALGGEEGFCIKKFHSSLNIFLYKGSLNILYKNQECNYHQLSRKKAFALRNLHSSLNTFLYKGSLDILYKNLECNYHQLSQSICLVWHWYV